MGSWFSDRRGFNFQTFARLGIYMTAERDAMLVLVLEKYY